MTIPLHEKGSHYDHDNYRGIALLSVPEKVLCKIIQKRLAERAEETLRKSQCGFRIGRGCVAQIFMLRIMAEKAREFNTSLYLAFVDLKKAYDLVNLKALCMESTGEKVSSAKQGMHPHSSASRNKGSGESTWQGVR